MAVRSTRQNGKKSTGMIIGRDGFAQISKVEGITLSGAAKADFRRYDSDNLSMKKRRQAIIAKYGGAKARS